ncbi:ead/Ea22-like family protein [Escherichia coli]|nr:ead/Ea22-like family protein [Escherichia coli]MCS1327172.1 ead/Ea22-like family protein [Escherichia coli]
MKQMSLIEMDGFLKGKCIPRDLKVNETNAEYLVRKFGELESKLETALRECRSAGITIDNLEAKCAALAAENELARKAVQAFCDVVGDNTEVIAEEVGRDGVLVILEAMKATGNIPATDAFLAEVRAQGVEMAMEHMQSSGSLTFGDCYISLNEFAAQLRKGGSQ